MASKGGGKIGSGGVYLVAKEWQEISVPSEGGGGIGGPAFRDLVHKEFTPVQADPLVNMYLKQKYGIYSDGKDANAYLKSDDFKIPDNEFYALRYYTGSGYGHLNSALVHQHFHGEALDAGTKDQISRLDKALVKLPGYRGEVHRGISVFSNFDTFMGAYKKGKTVTFPAYTSTTIRKGGGFSGNVHFKIMAKGKTAKTVLGLSQHDGEKEVLFARGAKFRVGKVERYGTDSATITLYEK